jgi:hypothetical protein
LQIGKSKTGVVAYLDAPLIMERLGLSGNAAADQATFVMAKLDASNIHVECLSHACDEIRDNLLAVLDNPKHLRTGPTADALRRGEVQDVFCQAVANDPEHYIRNVAKIDIRPANLSLLDQHQKCFPAALVEILANSMPSQNPTARYRDAMSIAIVMRRRAGHETRNLLDAKYIFITPNQAVVSAAIHLTRERGLVSQAKDVIGPAVTNRTIAGLVFANAGVSDKKTLSRRELLGACARVVMLRPRIVDQVREQFSQLQKIEDEQVLNAILTQPRGATLFMDYFVDQGSTISPNNHDELLAFIKKSLVEKEVESAQKVTTEKESIIRELEIELEKAKAIAARTSQQARLKYQEEQKKGSALEDQIAHSLETICHRSLREARVLVYSVTGLVAISLLIILGIGSLHNTTWIGYAMGWIAVVASAFGLIAWGLDLKAKWVDASIKKMTRKLLHKRLRESGLETYEARIGVTIEGGRVRLVIAPGSVNARS